MLDFQKELEQVHHQVDETKTGVKTATSEKSYTGSTSTQSERERALLSLHNTNFYDIMFVDILVGFCGYIV